MPTVVAYDVQQEHTAFKKNLFAEKFYNCVPLSDGSNRVLPNTTVMHPSNDTSVVSQAFNRALSKTTPNPGLEKVLIVPFSGAFTLTSDEKC